MRKKGLDIKRGVIQETEKGCSRHSERHGGQGKLGELREA